MAISLKTHKMLWGRSGNMCAFPECGRFLVADETLTDDPSIVGEEAHIVAQKKDGPRGKSDLTGEQRDKYNNLILLCSIHHKIIDDQYQEYTVEKLHLIKTSHEDWIRRNLSTDIKKTKDDELYASYIEKFIELTDLNNWNIWTSWILGSSEIFPKERFEALQKVPDYIVSRIWPKRYSELEAAFSNFKTIVNDLMMVYYKYPKIRSDGYAIERFYKEYYRERFMFNEEDWSRENELHALARYEYHVALVEDLVIELTRAANYICDYIRDFIFEGFRLEEGALLITRGDFFGSQTFRVEYRGKEREITPYKSLRNFMVDRLNRDFTIGNGLDESYFDSRPWDV